MQQKAEENQQNRAYITNAMARSAWQAGRESAEEKTVDKEQRHDRSQFFTVRLWLEELGDGQRECRGQVRRVTTSETRAFRDWPTLIALLLSWLSEEQSQRDQD